MANYDEKKQAELELAAIDGIPPLPDPWTSRDVKKIRIEAMKKFHPDSVASDDISESEIEAETARRIKISAKINAACDVLISYAKDHGEPVEKTSFSSESVKAASDSIKEDADRAAGEATEARNTGGSTAGSNASTQHGAANGAAGSASAGSKEHAEGTDGSGGHWNAYKERRKAASNGNAKTESAFDDDDEDLSWIRDAIDRGTSKINGKAGKKSKATPATRPASNTASSGSAGFGGAFKKILIAVVLLVFAVGAIAGVKPGGSEKSTQKDLNSWEETSGAPLGGYVEPFDGGSEEFTVKSGTSLPPDIDWSENRLPDGSIDRQWGLIFYRVVDGAGKYRYFKCDDRDGVAEDETDKVYRMLNSDDSYVLWKNPSTGCEFIANKWIVPAEESETRKAIIVQYQVVDYAGQVDAGKDGSAYIPQYDLFLAPI
jgi:hypothetical protein